jgi:hypothetical protein
MHLPARHQMAFVPFRFPGANLQRLHDPAVCDPGRTILVRRSIEERSLRPWADVFCPSKPRERLFSVFLPSLPERKLFPARLQSKD